MKELKSNNHHKARMQKHYYYIMKNKRVPTIGKDDKDIGTKPIRIIDYSHILPLSNTEKCKEVINDREKKTKTESIQLFAKASMDLKEIVKNNISRLRTSIILNEPLKYNQADKSVLPSSKIDRAKTPHNNTVRSKSIQEETTKDYELKRSITVYSSSIDWDVYKVGVPPSNNKCTFKWDKFNSTISRPLTAMTISRGRTPNQYCPKLKVYQPRQQDFDFKEERFK